MERINVQNLASPRTGEPVKNQFVITTAHNHIFQSYESQIAVHDFKTGQVTLGRNWDYSVTTVKYLMVFLDLLCWETYNRLPDGRCSGDRIRKAIKNGLIRYDCEMV